MKTVIDWEKFSASLETTKGERSARECSGDSGIDYQVLNRCLKGKPQSADTFAAACRWMRVPMETFLVGDGPIMRVVTQTSNGVCVMAPEPPRPTAPAPVAGTKPIPRIRVGEPMDATMSGLAETYGRLLK